MRSLDSVIRIRLIAEQGGVEYGWSLAKPLYYWESVRVQIKIDVLKVATDIYRATAFANIWDPRTNWRWAQWLSPMIDVTVSALYGSYLAGKHPCFHGRCY